ncbi:aminoglycoside 6'-N-acetyltransferase [Sphingomonas sp.]|jgi:aminoglycoside 6'-N-acetyltransferase I|uniref:aminoglycoside 6'-N-acetyltransferase n=1 Tax=Sphingomonas sp. TaxID=28214 RepID=UPI002ED92253
MLIEPATSDDGTQWAALRIALWPDEDPDGLAEGMKEMLDGDDMLALVARTDSGQIAGFAEASIRRDYVNGCETSPVAFLEGIYVAAGYRRQGVARALAERVADWGRSRGCREFGSDALIENRDSHAFHAAIGFAETERVVYFRREL